MTRCSTGRATQKYRGNGTDLSDILETPGDIIYADAAVSAENLVISGTTGDVLKVSASGIPEWGTSTSQWITSGDDISYSLGHVGIGTTSPDANLHVTGNTFVSTDLALGGTLTMGNVLVEALHELSAITATGNVTPHVIEFTNPTTGLVTTGNVGIKTSTPGYTLDVTGDINFTGALTQNGSTFGSSPWVTSGNDISYTTGRVGVGASTPDRDFHVVGTSRFDGEVEWYKVGQRTSHANYGTNRDWYIRSGGYFGKVVIQDGGGNVGIGTSSPQGNLHVSAGSAGDCRLILEADTDNNNEGDNPRIEFWQDGSIQESAIGMTSNRLNLWNSVSSGGGIAFHTNTVDGWTNAIERMTITSAGNVGINQTSPNYTLDVIGNINFTGALTQNGSVYGGGGSGSSPWVISGNDISYTTGRVGVGTSSPETDLHVAGDLLVDVQRTFQPTDTHQQQQKIQASDAQASDTFGYSVSLSSDGNTALVGAYLEDTGGTNAGAVYIFSGPTSDPRLFVDGSLGNVGIGTANPSVELHISGTGAIIVPSGTTAERPVTGATGMIRFNNTTYKYEGYGLNSWLDLSIADTAISQLYTFTSHTFTSCNGDSRYGPQLSDALATYGNISPWNDTNLFNIVTRGFQLWTVPKTGTYRITARGARGGQESTSAGSYNNTPGSGGSVRADIALTINTQVVFIVGQTPPESIGDFRSGSGGGATWVLKPGAYTNNDDVYMVAGGGGGAGPRHYNSGTAGHADASSQGTLGVGGTSHWNSNGGGAGWTADGDPAGARGGVRPAGGAMGGTGTTHGGFGGGGSESGDSAAGGAGATGGRAALRYNSTGSDTARGGTSYITTNATNRIFYGIHGLTNNGNVYVELLP